jgi:glutathione S-transferase
MYPTDLVQRAEVRRLVDWFDQKFYQDVTDAIVGEKLFAPLVRGESPESRYIRAGKSNFKIHATYMEWLLGQHECLAGDDWTAADFVAAAHLSLIDYTGDVPWAAYPVLKEWYMRIKSRPSFRPLLMDYFSPIKPAADYRNLDF